MVSKKKLNYSLNKKLLNFKAPKSNSPLSLYHIISYHEIISKFIIRFDEIYNSRVNKVIDKLNVSCFLFDKVRQIELS